MASLQYFSSCNLLSRHFMPSGSREKGKKSSLNTPRKSAIIEELRQQTQKVVFDMKHICIGVLAHVDSGKTTLSEGLLYASGALRKLGRVDHGDAFLDTDALERERGITIFSKQAMLTAGETELTLLDGVFS